jgi:hypothetical protein
MLRTMKYFGNVGAGVTSPQLFRANDQRFYVVKLQSNHLGPKILVNELLAAKFGQIMGLCFPPYSIIEITEQTLQQAPRLAAAGANPGRHFASLFISGTEYVKKTNIAKAINKTELAGVILFDHLFHNADRTSNYKNLLLRQEAAGPKIYAIDNSHLFIYGKWTTALLHRLSSKIKIYYHYTYGLLLRYYLSEQDFLPYLEIIARISNEQINNLVGEIPLEWLTDDLERQTLIYYIQLRRDLLEEIWGKLCRHIPRTHHSE